MPQCRFPTLIGVAFALTIVGCASINTTDDEAALRAHGDTWIRHYKSGDLDALMTLYEPDAIVSLHDQPGLFGRDAIRRYFAQSAGKNDVIFDLEHELIEVNGDVAHLMARYWLTATSKENGYVYKDAGRSLLIYKRGSDGLWRIAIDIDQNTPDVTWPDAEQ